METQQYLVCPLCYKKCKGKILKHVKEHGYNTEKEFLTDYPNCPIETEAWRLAKIKMSEKARERMKNPLERKKISDATKAAMSIPEFREKFRKIKCHPLSGITKNKMSVSISKALSNPEVKKKMYTRERNEKISKSKIKYWKNNPEKKIRVGKIWKLLRDRDPVKWKKHLLRISQSGFEAAWGKKETTLEERYYNILRHENIPFISQYELDGKLYDAHLTNENVLLEFDGTFWHPKSLLACQYEWQIHNYHNDREKDEIAKQNNMRLIRIREDEPIDSIKMVLNDIYNQ